MAKKDMPMERGYIAKQAVSYLMDKELSTEIRKKDVSEFYN